MPEIILPTDMNEQEEQEGEQINYTPTEEDEMTFFFIYHMHLQPSEFADWSLDKKRWYMARFMHQKNAEREMINQARLMQSMQGIDLTKG